MSDEVLLIEKNDGVATLTLNRPEAMNALSRELMERLTSAFHEIQSDEETRVAVITGSGRAFCAGMDLKELGSGGDASRGTKIGNPADEAMRAFEGIKRGVMQSYGFATKAGTMLDDFAGTLSRVHGALKDTGVYSAAPQTRAALESGLGQYSAAKSEVQRGHAKAQEVVSKVRSALRTRRS